MTRDHEKIVLHDVNGTIAPELDHHQPSLGSRFLDLPPFPYTDVCLQSFAFYGFRQLIASATLTELSSLSLWLRKHGLHLYIEKVYQRVSADINPVQFKLDVIRRVRPAALFENRADIARAVADTGVRVYLVGPQTTLQPIQHPLITPCIDFYQATKTFLKT